MNDLKLEIFSNQIMVKAVIILELRIFSSFIRKNDELLWKDSIKYQEKINWKYINQSKFRLSNFQV